MIDAIAEDFVKLGLIFGKFDLDYVDAYHGPKNWQEEADESSLTLADIVSKTTALLQSLETIDSSNEKTIIQARKMFLIKQISALRTKASIVSGQMFSFDEEASALYDTKVPTFEDKFFQKTLEELEAILPGKEQLSQRLDEYNKQFIIPKEKLDNVFSVCIAESRKRTKKYLKLPENESFTVEYVTNQPWSGYNWYQGNYRSIIQINTDLPIYVDRAIDLAAHEGYPGHHVYNVLIEKYMLKERGWQEFSLNALFSPSGFLSEGTAEYGIKVAFPTNERLQFEQEVICPLIQLDPDLLKHYHDLIVCIDKLQYGEIEVARRYLNQELTKDESIQWMIKHIATTQRKAEQKIRFFDKYRSYIINYSLGLDTVEKYVEKLGGTKNNPEKRWEIFFDLLTKPVIPSNLK